MNFFIDRRGQTFFFFYLRSVRFHFMDCLFDSSSFWQTHVLPICKHVLTKTCFSVHTTDSSANFPWLVLLNYQKFDDRSFIPGALWLAAILNSPKTNIFPRFLLLAIPNSAYLWKKFWKFLKKNYFAFLKKFPLFIEWTTYINEGFPIYIWCNG